MSDNNFFDEHIKNQFQNYTPSVHPRVWNNIVNKKDDKKPVGFWFNFFNAKNVLLMGAALLLASGVTYLLVKNTATPFSEKNIVAEGNKTNTTLSKINSKETEEVINNESPVNKKQIANTTSGNTNTILNINDGNYIPKNSIVYSNTKAKITTANGTADGGDFIINNRKKVTQPQKSKTNLLKDGDNNFYDSKIDGLDREIFNRLQFLNAQTIRVERVDISLRNKFSTKVYLPDCPSVEQNAAGNKTYFEVYGGPDIAFKNLSDTANSAYLQKRKESTSFSSAFSAGFRITKVFNNGVSIRTGVNYSQINEKFKFVQGNLVQITYIINAAGDTTGSYITRGTRYKTTYNKYKTIDIPVLFGYELGNGKFHANINAGVMVNVYSWQQGEVLDTNFQPISITTGKTYSAYQFKTNVGLGFLASSTLYYKLNEKLHLLAEPYFRYSLSPMSKENLTLKQKYNTAGLRLGIRLDLQ